MSGKSLIITLLMSAALLSGVLWFATRSRVEAPLTAPVHVDAERVRFPAIVNAGGFDRGDIPGYHAIVWRGGRAAGDALFQAQVTDVQVLDAMESKGLLPSDALTMDSWNERHNPEHPAPDARITGAPITVWVSTEGQPAQPLAHFLLDHEANPLDLRLGGHRALIPEWRSGCVLCLYSCPGSKVGNRGYTVRDFVEDTSRFRANLDSLPDDGTQVWVELRWNESEQQTN